MSTGRSVGRYTLESLLGRGGMGEVYRAHDERLRRHVAIKRIRPSESTEGTESTAGNDARRRARLEQEARMVAQLGHPAIVQVFDIFEDPEGVWVVMELIEGRTLAQILEEAPVGIDAVLRHGHTIADALDAAHRRGIIHRDLKVENVMLSDAGQIKILDFGLAKRLLPDEGASAMRLSVEGQVLGTVRAMSPEQARGLEVDERTDLFSLGVLLYELLAGSTPFASESPAATIARVMIDRQTSLIELPGMAERIPRALSELVDQLLEKAAELRPASAADVRARLQAISASRGSAWPGGAASASRVTEPSPSRRSRGRLDEQATQGSSPAVEVRPDEQATQGSNPAADAGPTVGPTVGLTAPLTQPAAGPPPRAPRARRTRRWLVGLGAAVAAVVVIVLRTGAGPAPASTGQPVAAAPSRDPRAAYERGMSLLRNFHRPGAIDEAAGIFQRLLREDERSAAAYAGLARAYWRRYTFTDETRDAMFLQQAQAAADRAVALDEFLVDARVSHGLVALELGQVERAGQDFQAALSLDGKNADAYGGMAQLYQHQQHLDEAEAAYRKAIALAPQAPQLYDDLGALQLQRGKYEDAIQLFENSIALAPDSAYGYSNLGAVYLMQGRYEEAAQRFQDALKIHPSSSLYGNLGTVLFAQGLYGPAARAFERSLAMGGASHDHLRWANLADAYRQLPDGAAKAREDYAHAIELIDGELEHSPQDLTLRTRRALYLAKGGDCQRADAGLPSLIDTRDAPPYALYRVAVTLEICGHRERAIATLERALASGFSAAEIGNDPELRALRADPAYHRMIDRRGQSAISGSSPSTPR